jgi:integrase
MASFRKHENGWEYRIRYKDPRTQKFKEKSKRGFATKKEAQLAAAKVEQEIQNKLFIYNDSITFQQAFDEWWAAHSKTIKQSTQYTTYFKFTKYILPAFGKMKLKDITKAYCQQVIDEIAEKIDSVNDYKIQANQVFKYAKKMEYIAKNPMELVIVPKKEEDFLAETEIKRNYWTKEELKHFLELAKKEMEPQDYVMFYLLLYTGMRKGELLALEWKDINLDEKRIYIHQTLFFKNNKEILQKVKTYQSRTIFIDNNTAKILKKWSVQQREYLLGCGENKKPKNVLTRPDMRPLRLAHPNDKLKSFIKQHNLHPINIHGLRHTHASILFEAGASVKEVQDRLGHRDIKTTMNIYTHVTTTVKEKTADIFQRYLES